MPLDHYLRSLASERPAGFSEADVQSDIKALIIEGLSSATPPRLEEQVGDGSRRRIDVASGATVIEAKKQLTTLEGSEAEIRQLEGYVRTRMAQTNSRYNGILTDGVKWWLFEVNPHTGEFEKQAEHTHALGNAQALLPWLQAVIAMPAAIAPTQKAVESYLGSSSPAYAQDANYLLGLYRDLENDPTLQLKRELWARLLRTALGTGFEDDTQLFIDHTLLVLEAMAIGHAVMGVPLAELVAHPRKMLTGEYFADAGLHNIMEAGFFDWITASDKSSHFLAKLIERINIFSWEDIEHDVLKVLYESIINAPTRKSLGEYYTPDYLAQGVIEQTVTDPLSQRVLDPSCGSGTFIFHTIRLMRSAAKEAGYSPSQTLKHIQNHVYGLDIHPVSILLARITYLLALGSLLRAEGRGEIWAQVYLGDSVQWHQPGAAVYDEIRVNVESGAQDITVAEDNNGAEALFNVATILVFPLAGIDDATTFDRLVTDLTTKAKTYTNIHDRKPDCSVILRRYGLTNPDVKRTLTETFYLLCDLNAVGRDSIWGYYVRNQVRPLWLSMEGNKVDVLVGNPPWVAYRFMTESMKKIYQTFSAERGLWTGGKLATQQDLVDLFIVRACEKYLEEGGSFGFITPYAVLSRGQYAGFRAGKWGWRLRGKFTAAWDLHKLRPHPFPVPAAAVFGTKYTREVGARAEDLSIGWIDTVTVYEGLRDKSGWKETLAQVTITEGKPLEADSSKALSPYREVTTQGATLVPRFLIFVEEEGNSPLGIAAGKTRVRSLRPALEKEPWKSQPDVDGIVEKKHIHPVHLGSTLLPFRTTTPWKAVLPVEGGNVVDVKELDKDLDTLGIWWDKISTVWEDNKSKSTKLSLWERQDYQRCLSRQLPLAKHRVIYSASGSMLAAARLSSSKELIESSLYWIPVTNVEEALYLTAILNAPVTTQAVEKYQSQGIFGARHFHTYVWMLPIPTYDEDNALHQQLVDLARRSEEIAEVCDISDMGFQQARKVIREALTEASITEELNALVSALLAQGIENSQL